MKSRGLSGSLAALTPGSLAALTIGASAGMALTPPAVLLDFGYRDSSLDRRAPKYRDTKAWNLERNRIAAKAARKARRVTRKHKK